VLTWSKVGVRRLGLKGSGNKESGVREIVLDPSVWIGGPGTVTGWRSGDYDSDLWVRVRRSAR
jgi:hypothetical protein